MVIKMVKLVTPKTKIDICWSRVRGDSFSDLKFSEGFVDGAKVGTVDAAQVPFADWDAWCSCCSDRVAECVSTVHVARAALRDHLRGCQEYQSQE